MNSNQLEKYIIEPTLKYFSKIDTKYSKIYSPEAVKLLLMTAAVESDMGEYIIQNNNKMKERDKALGVYQIEMSTIDYIIMHKSSKIVSKVLSSTNNIFDVYTRAICDMSYSTIMARLVYWYKTPDKIPNINDNESLWKFYKKCYNSYLGKTTKEKFFNLCSKHKII